MRFLLGLSLLLGACPERQAPERGVQLVYKKPHPDPVRSVVDRRLAQLKLRANLQEDDTSLTVRVPEGADVSRIKALFAQAGHLEFCGEDGPIATRWCESSWPAGVSLDNSGTTCALLGATRKDLETALADAGGDFAFGTSGTQASAFTISGCLSPRIVAAELREDGASLNLEFDRASGREFATLTRDLVGRRLIIRLDGVVHSAPVVMEPITGGKAMLTVGQKDRATMEVLAAALVGGALPPLVLEREGTWGPPSLKR